MCECLPGFEVFGPASTTSPLGSLPYLFLSAPPTPHHLVSPLSPPCVECGRVSRPLQFCCKSHDDPGNTDRGEAEPTPQWLLLERRYLQKQRKRCVSVSRPRFCFPSDSLVTCFLWSQLGGMRALTKACWAPMNQRAMPTATFFASLPPGGFGGRAKIILQTSQPQALTCAFTSCPIGDVPTRRSVFMRSYSQFLFRALVASWFLHVIKLFVATRGVTCPLLCRIVSDRVFFLGH